MWKKGKREGISIGKYSKFGIDATASGLFHLENIDEISTLLAHQNSQRLPLHIIGAGSNTVCAGTHVEKLIVKNNLSGVATTESGDDVLVTAAAGESWDNLVARTIRNGWSGLAALSAIPGSVGAAPIQNIGAYGAEVADVIETVFVYDLQKNQKRTLTNKQCQFSYRWSIFKDHPRRFIVLSVTFRLSTDPPEVPSYGTIAGRLSALGNGQPTLAEIREMITKIRWSKLPRPDETPNVGSFFHNPVVSENLATTLKSRYSDMPTYDQDSGVKIPAGWLIEECGLKGVQVGTVGTHQDNALVITSTTSAEFADLSHLIGRIRQRVKSQFGITLEREPDLLW